MLAGDTHKSISRSAASIAPIGTIGIDIDHQCDPVALARLASHDIEHEPAGRRTIKIFDCGHVKIIPPDQMGQQGSPGLISPSSFTTRHITNWFSNQLRNSFPRVGSCG
jgi:hypothetical protein